MTHLTEGYRRRSAWERFLAQLAAFLFERISHGSDMVIVPRRGVYVCRKEEI